MGEKSHKNEVVLIKKPQLSCDRAKIAAAEVLRVLTFGAVAKENDLGFVFATHGRIAASCGLSVKQIRLALSRLETGGYIIKQRSSNGLGIIITNFSEQRLRFGVVDNPEILEATPEGMLPVRMQANSMKGDNHVYMGSMAN